MKVTWFVGNVPYNMSEDELKDFFKTRVSRDVDFMLTVDEQGRSCGRGKLLTNDDVDLEVTKLIGYEMKEGLKLRIQPWTDKKSGGNYVNTN